MAKFPDLTGDGEVTQADVLKGRGVYKKGGSVMKNDHGHKPMAKMSHGGHYCWGGKVMKKAEGGDVKKVMTRDKERLEGLSEGAKESIGLPISVYDKGKYDPKASRKIMDENFEEGLRQSREEHGRKMKKEYGSTEDYSYKYPNEDYDSTLPKGRSYKTKATEGMKRGGKVMKKADGGKIANPNRFPTMSTPPTPIKRPGAPFANLGSGGSSRPSINPALILNKPLPRPTAPPPTTGPRMGMKKGGSTKSRKGMK